MSKKKKQEAEGTKAKKHSSNFFVQLFKTKPLGGFGLVVLIIILLIAIFADVIAPYPMVDGSLQIDAYNKLASPSLAHPLGTDTLGRDLLSYMIYGARTSAVLCIACTLISTLISVIIGVSSAVIGGKFDLILQRFVDAWQCIPATLITLIMMSLMGNGTLQLIVAISVPAGIGGSRMIRSTAMSVKDAGYVKMSEMLGAKTGWKMMKHVIPNITPVIIIQMAGSLGGVVMQEASMNFLGYGVEVGTPSWGALITDTGRMYMFSHPMLAWAPGVAIALMVFSSAMLGDAVRDLLDPRLKGGVGNYNAKKLRKIAAKIMAKESEEEDVSAEA